MILVADSGSTKAHWRAIYANGHTQQFETKGINPLHQANESSTNELQEQLVSQLTAQPEAIYFYGAGCATPDLCQRVSDFLRTHFPDAHIEVESDMLGAARALHQQSPGVASILGTGSNSCFYDGKQISEKVPALGYILGDEGSGAVMGIAVLNRYFKKDMPEELARLFLEQYQPDTSVVLAKVYNQERPSRYLASFSRFIYDNLNHPYMKQLARTEIKKFFDRNIAQYTRAKDYPLGFVGSISWYYQDIIKELAEEAGYQAGTIIQAPIEALAHYHLQTN